MLHIEVTQIEPRDELKKVLVKVMFHQNNKEVPSHNVRAEVFIDHTDSYAEIRRRAIEEARNFFRDILAVDAVETPFKYD